MAALKPEICRDVISERRIIQDWAYQWKMAFNPDPNKQAVVLIFSQKKNLFTLPISIMVLK